MNNGFRGAGKLTTGKSPAVEQPIAKLGPVTVPSAGRIKGQKSPEEPAADIVRSTPAGDFANDNAGEVRAMPRHFEKTVEWVFVQTCLPDLDFAAPLAGDFEPWGDAMMKLADKWLLIEFKATESEIQPGEARKYPSTSVDRKHFLTDKCKVSDDVIAAAEKKFDELKGCRTAPHVLVFGKLSGEGSKLALRARRYWSWAEATPDQATDTNGSHPDDVSLDFATCGELGLDYRKFESYARDVVVAKAGKWRSKGRGTHAGVVGLANNKPVVSMLVEEFLVGAKIALASTFTAQAAEDYTFTPTPGGPGLTSG